MQDDEPDRLEFIPKMHLIYGFASVTIVAATGDNADAGLPGVEEGSRTRRLTPFTIKGTSLLKHLILWSLPTSFLTHALMWNIFVGRSQVFRTSARRREEMCSVRSADGLIVKCPFPSWSWLGWVPIGEINPYFNMGIQGNLIKFYYRDGSGVLVQPTGAASKPRTSVKRILRSGKSLVLTGPSRSLPRTFQKAHICKTLTSPQTYYTSGAAVQSYTSDVRHRTRKSLESFWRAPCGLRGQC